jgi:hypothetical protein
LLIQGNSFAVQDLTKKGKNCHPGFNSHIVKLTKQPHKFAQDYFPVTAGQTHEADEIVVFHEDQILPVFLVTLTCKS